jgi:HlyD family secretion protein
MKKVIVGILVLAAVGVSGGAYYAYRRQPKPPEITKGTITRGSVVDTVGATGTLEAVTTVQVGSQVSGTVMELNADFNSIVRKGQIIARLDPSLFQTQIDQARANLVRAQADIERLKVSLEDAKTKLQRAEDLAKRNLIPPTELETAQVNYRSIEAQLKSAQAAMTQAQANLNQAEVNLQHTIIRSPIDGIVISRNVDVGQTVAASLNAPTLFLLAADLTKMQVRANVDEADVGRIRPGQRVRFRVDAYPTEEFEGRVSQVRLQPTVVQNVVTYTTVIDVPNPQLKLKPGMTANVNIEIARAENVLRVPNAALRFRPTAEMFTALNLPVPPELQRGGGRAGGGPREGRSERAEAAPGGGRTGTAPTAGAPRGQTADAGRDTRAGASGAFERGGGDQTEASSGGGPEAGGVRRGGRGGFGQFGQMDPERRRQFLERLQNLPPDERQRAFARMRGGAAEGGGPGGAAPANRTAGPEARPLAVTGAQTIDSLFGPLPRQESFGRVWLWVNNQLKPVRVRLGISDGTYTELLSDELPEGTEVVTGILLEQPRAVGGQTTGSMNPFMPQPGRGPGFGPGGPGGRR